MYLLNAHWLCLLLSSWLAALIIAQYGAHIPDVPWMHSGLENALMTQLAANAEDKDPGAVKILKTNQSAQKQEAFEAQSVRLLKKQRTEIDGNSFIPNNLKNVVFALRAISNIIPWPVYLLGFALLVSVLNGLWFLFHSFMKGLWWGLACMFVPIAATVFEFKYWREVRRSFEIGIVCSCLFGICLGTYFGTLNYAPVEDARKCFATQINQFQMPGATEMNIAAPDIVATGKSASFVEASLAALANSEKGRTALKSLVKKKGKFVEVTFPEGDKLKLDEKGLGVSSNRDTVAKAIEVAFIRVFDVNAIRMQTVQTGQPAIASVLQALTGKDTLYTQASTISADETAALVLDLLGRGIPVVVSAKGAKEIGSPEVLVSPCYAVLSADLDTKQALLYNCSRQGRSVKEGLPGVEELGNGLVKVPFALFPKYIRFIAYLDKW